MGKTDYDDVSTTLSAIESALFQHGFNIQKGACLETAREILK